MSELNHIGINRRFSECVVHDGKVYISGQVDFNRGRGVIEQTKAVLNAIDSLLIQAGTDKHHILKAEVYLADIGDYADMNKVWEEWVSPTPPARSTLQSALPDPGWLIQISAVASIPEES